MATGARRISPPEKDVARGLREQLALDDPAAVMPQRRRSHMGLEHGTLRFLHLQDEVITIRTMGALEQADPTACPHAADADDLTRNVDDAKAVEQRLQLVREAFAVAV